jgi:excinuclease ABC subunit C
VQAQQGINPQTIEEADVFALHQQGGQTCIQVFFFRTGQNWGNRAYFPKADRSLASGEVLTSFIAQFYDATPAPRLVLSSHEPADRDLLAEALALGAGHRVDIVVPQRGEKRELVRHALDNAREALGRRLAETSTQGRLLAALGATFGLDGPPRRIEVYDNSHTMGAQAVGAMIVAGPEGFAKNRYRKFNIRSEDLSPGDDFGMMREVLRRRFTRLLREAPRDEAAGDAGTNGAMPEWPDLVLIDGGPGQLAAARAVLDELGVDDVALVGIAKGRDRDAGRELLHAEGRPPFRLEPRDPVLYLVQRLRDEAHRFAIGSHRARRGKALLKSPIEDIPGIGPQRKRALLRHFGNAKEVARAARADLEKVAGINRRTAQIVYDHFHERGEA